MILLLGRMVQLAGITLISGTADLSNLQHSKCHKQDYGRINTINGVYSGVEAAHTSWSGIPISLVTRQ